MSNRLRNLVPKRRRFNPFRYCTGEMLERRTLLSNALFPNSSPTYPTGSGPNYDVSADFNGDGNADLAVVNDTADTISIFLGNGHGGFTAGATYPTGNTPGQIVAADFTGDGITDLAFTNVLDDTVSVLPGHGDGTFGAALTSPVGNAYGLSLAAGDFNHDGVLDLAVAIDTPSGLLSILIGKGNGYFQAPVLYNIGSSPTSVVVGNFDGDNNPDLAVTDYSSNAVSVLYGFSNGTFAAPVSFATGTHPYAVVTSDFNSDGKNDLAVADYGGNSVSVLMGNGDGTFASPVNYAVGSGPIQITTADFDGDGKLDLAVADEAGDKVSVLLGNGDGTFASATNYPAGSEAEGITVADFNNDTQPDLAVTNVGDNNVSILLNQLGFAAPPPAQTALAARPQSFTLGSFNQTTTGPYTVDVNWGDGSADTTLTLSAPGTIPVQSHAYLTPGVQNLKAKVTVTDASGSRVAVATFGVTVNAITNLTSIDLSQFDNYSQNSALAIDGAGNLFGTTRYGGIYNDGTIFELSQPNHNVLTRLYNFNNSSGANPVGGLILDGAGNLFGTTEAGGASNDGTIFELSSDHQTLTTLFSFNSSSGTGPIAALTLDPAGDLFGTTVNGGTANEGTIFELSPDHQTLTTLVSFNSSNGAFPYGSLTLDISGNLFGTTYGGGSYGFGTVFELPANHQTLTSLVSFNNTDGADPFAGLTIDSSGNLYGTTNGGGNNFDGTVFELSANYQTLTTLVSFNYSNGASPKAGLTINGAGNIFGTTSSGGTNGDGTIFEVLHNTHSFQTLVSFNSTNGITPDAALAIDGAGNLFGTTEHGGSAGGGTVFKLSSNTLAFTTLVNVSSTVGSLPVSGLTLDSAGDLFGTTQSGGTSGDGTVFELSSDHQTLTTLVNFNYSNGADPCANLTLDSAGDLFGTTYRGGTSGLGTVFELSANHQTLITLVNFNGSNGANPIAALTLDSTGDLFGTTLYGGSSFYGTAQDYSPGYGTVFELSPNHQTLTTLVNFNYSNGGYPYASLTLDSAGNLFGTTEEGGSSYYGTLFELSANHQTLSTLFNFNYSNGAYPIAGVTLDSAGDLFSTTFAGGSNSYGTLFELSANHQTLTTLFSFNYGNGGYSRAGVILDSAGDLFGTSSSGGSGGQGTVFELSANHRTLTSLVNFNYTNGANPSASLTLDNAGDLFGTTSSGGVSNTGTIFEITPTPASNSPLFILQGETIVLNEIGESSRTATAYAGIAIQSGTSMFIAPSTSSTIRQLLIINGFGLSIDGTNGTWTGKLDLGNNDLDVAGGSLSTITNQLQQGFANGTWDGTGGITSASASTDTTHLTALGVIQNNQSGSALYTSGRQLDGTTPGASDIIVKYTYYGDANLDGKVDGSDYSLIDNGYLQHLTGWYNGDFNYDGVVNGSDYTLIDNAFNMQGASLAAEISPASMASKLVSSAARPAAIFAEAQSVLQSSWTAASSDVATLIFSPDTDDLLKRHKFSQSR